MTPSKEIIRYYRTKAEESFRSRFGLLLFQRSLNGNDTPISKQELDDFRIEDNEETLKKYVNIYWQKEEYEKEKIDGKIINDIYHEMTNWREKKQKNIDELRNHYVNNIFKNVFPLEEFKDFIGKRNKCEYCHITKDLIADLIEKKKLNKKKHTRGWSLEIDRKKPNHEYTKDNSVWCCYWCNNAKTDEFTYDEFQKIGSVIKTIWDERLGR